MSTPTKEQQEIVRSIRRRCMGRLDDGSLCGHDINEIILTHPFDGAAHEYECPGCGREGLFTSPRFDEPEEETAA